jgi:site-specific DNA recombinase
MRLLAPIRLSRDTDASNNPATQREAALEYADAHPGTVLIFTEVEDLDVSGAIPIRERPGIGPYLTPEKIGTWDGIIGSDMDRISRNLLDYLGFAQDIMKRGKIIIDLSDGTDTSTLRGRQTLEDRVRDAQRYREQVAEKRARAAKRIADAGRWGGGHGRFGYMPVCVCHGIRRCPDPVHTSGWHLVQDPVTSTICKRMVNAFFAGQNFHEIVRWLIAEGIPSAQGKTWRPTGVRHILKSPSLMGVEMQKRNNVAVIRRDRNGDPVRFTDDPILSDDRFRELQALIAERAYKRAPGISNHMLWRIAYCRKCSVACTAECDGQPCPEHDVPLRGMRHQRASHEGYYICANYSRCKTLIRIDKLEDEVTGHLLTEAGGRWLLEKVLIPGDDHSAEIIKLEKRAERLRSELDDEYDEDIERSVLRIEKRLAELLSPDSHTPDTTELRPVEPRVTVAQHWETLDTSGRNTFMRDWGVVAYADRRWCVTRLGFLPADEDTFPLA